MNINHRLLSAVGALLLIALVGCGGTPDQAATAEDTAVTVPAASATGLELYVTYCQGCHGTQGTGDGPVAPLLKTPPPDLTGLVAKYGEFPEELVAATVDGRADVASHGTREMPVWGNVWNDPNDPLGDERVQQQIGRIVEFVRSIQVVN